MTITDIFFDIGGELGTDGWDEQQRRLAAERFELDPADLTRRHQYAAGMLEAGRMALDEYLDVTTPSKRSATGMPRSGVDHGISRSSATSLT